MTDQTAPGLSRAARMENILRAAFAPTKLAIVDDSGRHAGHAGASGEGETHFDVTIVSECFQSRGRLERSRMVYSALNEEFSNRLHALSLTLRTPEEEKS